MHDAKRPRSSTSSRTNQFLSDDAWSHVVTFMATDPWETAIGIARMNQTCRAWSAAPLWAYYSRTFGIFPFSSMPTSVKALMKAASERKGFVNQKTAMEHLKINASYLRTISHKTLRLGMGRKMYLYGVGDVLRVATDRFQTVEAMEKHVLKCQRTQVQRFKNQQAKEQRRESVAAMLWNINASFILHERIGVKEIDDFVDKNRGTLDAIRAVALAMKQARDVEQARARLVKNRRAQYRQWIQEIRLSQDKYLGDPVVRRFIYDGVGTKEDVVQAVHQAFQADQERYAASMQQAPDRRAQLAQELAAHGLTLRPDSKFCRQYIRGETSASLQEVVATMKLTSFLFSFGHRTWSRWHNTLETAMKIRMQTGQFECWYAACEHVIETNTASVQNDGGGGYDQYSDDDWA